MAKRRLDQAQRGGYYIGANGKPHDAEGRPLPGGRPQSKNGEPTASKSEAKPAEKKGALPKGFPGLKQLTDAGVDSWESLRSVAEVLSEIDGLDAVTIEAIRAELAKAK